MNGEFSAMMIWNGGLVSRADILNSIYDVYGHSSAYDLMQQTHREKPWQITQRNQVISDQVIKDFYSGVFVADEN